MQLLNCLGNDTRQVGSLLCDGVIDPLDAGDDPALVKDAITFIQWGRAALCTAQALATSAPIRPVHDCCAGSDADAAC